ncbi:MAG: acyl-CoA dehydrogenase family protein [Tissierellia bacterium]|nr:acyl-CoA dehydrogenase family protein [Tissierellia bacterium]
MYFHTNEEHEALRRKVRDFAEAEIAPIAAQLDAENRYPDEIVAKMADLGIMGLPTSEKYSGGGQDIISYAIAVEELSRVDGGVGVVLSAHTSLGTYPIDHYGTEDQKQKYLHDLASGKKVGAFGLTEPNAGSDAGGTETVAIDQGDHYLLSGSKIFITNAPKAEVYVVFAVTTPGIGTKGISAFIVEKGWEGFTFSDHYDKLGIRSSTTAELHFSKVKVPKENLLGQEGKGFNIAMATLDGGRIGIASQALGIAQGAFEEAVKYAKTHKRNGRYLAESERVRDLLVDMNTKLEVARNLIYRAAAYKFSGVRYGKESAMAKMYASDIALDVVDAAVQLMGGEGYIKGTPVERHYRDAKITTIYEGTNEIQRVVIGANIIGRLARDKSSGAAQAKKKGSIVGDRKKQIFEEGDLRQQVKDLVAQLKKDGYDFTVGIDLETPIMDAQRVVSMGKGFGGDLELAKKLAKAFGAAIGSSRPVAETDKVLPIERYVGMSGQKFGGNLYVACGISGAGQHLKGIKDAATIVAINKDSGAPIFKNADYGIVADIAEVAPLLIEELGIEDKAPAPEMVKMKRQKPRKTAPSYGLFVCKGCGYEYDAEVGDEEGGIEPGTRFDQLPEEWICPSCGEAKDMFIKVGFSADRTFE